MEVVDPAMILDEMDEHFKATQEGEVELMFDKALDALYDLQQTERMAVMMKIFGRVGPDVLAVIETSKRIDRWRR